MSRNKRNYRVAHEIYEYVANCLMALAILHKDFIASFAGFEVHAVFCVSAVDRIGFVLGPFDHSYPEPDSTWCYLLRALADARYCYYLIVAVLVLHVALFH